MLSSKCTLQLTEVNSRCVGRVWAILRGEIFDGENNGSKTIGREKRACTCIVKFLKADGCDGDPKSKFGIKEQQFKVCLGFEVAYAQDTHYTTILLPSMKISEVY